MTVEWLLHVSLSVLVLILLWRLVRATFQLHAEIKAWKDKTFQNLREWQTKIEAELEKKQDK
jgi:hypothetical protein